jgi:Bacterial Ig-like domain (group 3)
MRPQRANFPERAAAAKFNNVYYGDPGSENWIYGSSTDPTTGNAYVYINGHATPMGHDYWAEKEADFVLNDFPSMTPQTFPLFDPAPAAGAFSYSAAQQAILPAGQQKLSVTFTPQDSTNYTAVTQQAILTVEKASSSISLSSSASSIAPGASLTLASTVSPQIGGVPTGTVTFLDNGIAIATSPLNQSGAASFSTSSLATGSHVITASYSGDGNFFSSMTNPPLTVMVVKPDFSFSLGSTQLTVLPSQSATTVVTVNPIAGLTASLNLSCSGLPVNATCSLQNGSQIAVNQQTTKAALLIAGYAPKTVAVNGISKLRGIEVCGLFGLAFILTRKNRKALSGWVASVVLLFAGFGLISGCGSNTKINTAAPGTYTVQVTLTNAADASTKHSQTIIVVIP